MQNICVYCASSSQVRQVYFDAAEQLGKVLADNDCRLIYGGGQRGLMGKIADTVLAAGGKVTGIIPGFMCEVEWNHTGLTELILVNDMRERKEKLAKIADAIVAKASYCSHKALMSLWMTKGHVIEVEEEQIRDALDRLMQEGYIVEPSSATVVAALSSLEETLHSSDVVVSILTGSGVKMINTLNSFLRKR